jgi:hypothetical protein
LLTIKNNKGMREWYTSHGGDGNPNVITVIIEEGVTFIEASAFVDCLNLTSVTLPQSLTSINRAAFYLCVNLSSVTIPAGVTNIGDLAFFDCLSLSEICFLSAAPPQVGEYAFFGAGYNVPGGTVAIVPLSWGLGTDSSQWNDLTIRNNR